MGFFAVEDLFAVGIGFDIAGAYLLGRGLLSSTVEIARRAASYVGYSSPLAVSQIEDKVDGAIGLSALLFGFVLQAIAYALTLSRDQTGNEESAARATTAIVLALLAITFVLGLWRVLRPRFVGRAAVAVARINVFKPPFEFNEKPYGALLQSYGEEMGHERSKAESESEYAKRVFGIDNIEPGGPS